MGKRAKFGDVLEIPTKKGLAYALYTHRHIDPPKFGALLRIFKGFYSARPTDFTKVLNENVRFTTFFPLQAAMNKGIFEIVANVSIPVSLQNFPIFKCNNKINAELYDDGWWIWDGLREKKIGRLNEDQKIYPYRSIVNDVTLIGMIEGEYGPDEKF